MCSICNFLCAFDFIIPNRCSSIKITLAPSVGQNVYDMLKAQLNQWTNNFGNSEIVYAKLVDSSKNQSSRLTIALFEDNFKKQKPCYRFCFGSLPKLSISISQTRTFYCLYVVFYDFVIISFRNYHHVIIILTFVVANSSSNLIYIVIRCYIHMDRNVQIYGIMNVHNYF